MTQTIAYLEAVVGADITSFRREMQNVRRELGILSDSAAGLQHLGRTLTLGLTTPLVAFGAAAVASASEFDAAMRNVSSISQEFSDNLAEASERTLELGSNIRGGPMAAAEALYVVVSSGITDMETAFAIAEAGAMTAQAGLADMAGTTQALTSVMLAYGASAEEAGTYSDILTRTVQVGVGSMEEFSGALSRIVPTANLLDISFQDIGAGLAFLTQRGIDASEASTALTGALKKILNPTEAMSAAFQELGVSSGADLIEQFGGLQGAMEALINTVSEGGNVDETALFDMFNEVRAFKAAATFANDLEAFGNAFVIFGEEVDGATARALQEQMASFAAHFDLMKSALAGFAVTVGNALLPILMPIIDGLRGLFLMAQDLPPELIMMGVAFAGVVAAAGPLLWIIGSLITPVGLLLGAVAGLGVAFATNFGGVRDSIIDTATKALPHLDDLATAVTDFFKLLTGEGDVPVPDSSTDFRSIFGGGGLNVNATEAITFTVEPGDVPGQIAAALQEAGHNVTWEQVLAATGTDAFLPGTYTMTVPGPSNAEVDLSNTTITMPNWWEQPLEYETSGGEGESTLGGRLAEAVATAWPRVQEALEGLKTDISNWFTNTFIPGFDKIGGQVLDALSSAFSGTNVGGDTDFYEAVRGLFNGGIDKAVGDLATIFQENFPQISKALATLIANISGWIQTDGIPALANTLGYIVATLGILLRDAISSVFSGTGMSDALSNAATNFNEGFRQALADQGHTKDDTWTQNILTGLVGSLALAMAGTAFVSLLTGKGIGGALSAAIGLATKGLHIVIDAGSWLVSLAGGAIGKTGLGAALSGALSSALLPLKAGLMVMLDQLSFALFSAKYYITLAGQSIVSAVTTFLTTALASAGVITITAGAFAVAATIASAAFVVLGVNYGAREAMAVWLENEMGQDPVDVNILFGINPILDIGSEASQNELWGAFEENGTVGIINQMLFRDPHGNSEPVQISIPVEIAPNLTIDAAASTSDTNGSLASQLADGDYFTELPEEMRPKFTMAGDIGGKEIKDAADAQLRLGFAEQLNAALEEQFALLDFAAYVPIESIATAVVMTTDPFLLGWTTLFGTGGTLETLFIGFGELITNAIPGVVSAVTSFVESTVEAFEPLYNILYGIVGMMGALSGNPNMGLSMDGYASGGMMNGPGMIGGRGMEFFAPGENGMIVPTRKLRDFMAGNSGGGGGDNYIVNAYGEAPYRVARMVEKAQKDRTRTQRKVR